MGDRSDFELLSQYVQQGSQAAFAELVRRYVDMVYTAAARQVRDRHAAEDVTQVVFIVLARKARTLREGSLLGPWRIHNRVALDYVVDPEFYRNRLGHPNPTGHQETVVAYDLRSTA